jgi:predicted nicotinamide N-methyase
MPGRVWGTAGLGRGRRRPPSAARAEQAGARRAQVCFAAEPTWLAFEWTDGAPAAMYITPHRDALAAAVLDAAQARRRPAARAPRPCAALCRANRI